MSAANEAVRANPLGTEPVSKLILKFSVPAILSMLVNAVYNIVDQIFIGYGIGMMGIAATTVALPFTTICTAAGLMVGIGGASNFNLSLGEGRKDEASLYAGNAISLSAVVGCALAVVFMVFLNPVVQLFGATEAILPLALPYTRIIVAGIPFLIFSTAATYMIRADGSPTYSMLCMLSGGIFNLIFDPIFLFVFNMGIEGIALATLLGQMLSAGLSILYLLRRFHSVPLHRQHLRPRLHHAGRICALGAASCFNQLAMTVVQIAMNNVLRYYGAVSDYGSEIPLAVVGAISKVNILFLSFTIGLAQGCQPINSFNYGAKQYARVRQAFKTALVAACVISVVTFLVFQLFPRQIILVFGEDDPLYLQFGVRYLRVYMLMAFTNGFHPVTANYFTSIGKAYKGILISMTRQILFLLPLLLLLPMAFGIDGVMYAGPVSDGCAAVLSITFAARELVRLKRLAREEEAVPAAG